MKTIHKSMPIPPSKSHSEQRSNGHPHQPGVHRHRRLDPHRFHQWLAQVAPRSSSEPASRTTRESAQGGKGKLFLKMTHDLYFTCSLQEKRLASTISMQNKVALSCLHINDKVQHFCAYLALPLVANGS
jgi:hypothetical protein